MPAHHCISFLVTFHLSILLLMFSSPCIEAHVGHSATEELITYKQPSGKVIKLRMIGNNQYARTECEEGYTLVFNKKAHAYYYANLNSDGTDFIMTKHLADGKAPKKLKRHLKLAVHARSAKAKKEFVEYEKERNALWKSKIKSAKKRRALKKRLKKAGEQEIDVAQSSAGGGEQEKSKVLSSAKAGLINTGVIGSRKGLTILVQFPDDSEDSSSGAVDFPTTVSKIERYCNEIGYNDDGNTGSIRDYFRDQSNGLLDYTMLVTPIVTLAKPRNYYNYSDYPVNKTFRSSGVAGNQIVVDAIEVLKRQGFSFDGLTLNSSGEVETVNVLFAGASSGVWSEGLWPHAWKLLVVPGTEVTVNGVSARVNTYQISNMESSFTKIGTFCHELGHSLLGFPDLYDKGFESNGIGRHGLMASGSGVNFGRTPAPINLSFKDVVGWANITDISATDYMELELPATGNVGYRITNPSRDNEYFLIEHRHYGSGQLGGDRWAQHVPDQGVMIWHIDDNVRGNENEHMNSYSHYQVSLEQQDGDFDLEGGQYADYWDLYDAFSPGFNDYSLPSSRWWSGGASGLSIKVIEARKSRAKVVFGADYIAEVKPSGGTLLNDFITAITWKSRMNDPVRIDLYRLGAFVKNIALNEVNDGSYPWLLTNIADDRFYKVRVTSMRDSAVFAESELNFSVSTVDYLREVTTDGVEYGIGDEVDIKWVSNIEGEVRIELHRGGEVVKVIANGVPNSGSYGWQIVGVEDHPDYRVRVISLKDTSFYSETVLDLSITTETFLVGGKLPAGWKKSADSDKGWKVVNNLTHPNIKEASEGRFALMNEDIIIGEDAGIEVTMETGAGEIRFDTRVSMHEKYDFLRFYIDGVEQDLRPDLADENGLSGDLVWQTFVFPVPVAGVHTFKWRYVKQTRAGYFDAAWIDNVILPRKANSGVEAWRLRNFTTQDGQDVVGDGADPDGDKISNLMEYALGLDPNKKDAGSGIGLKMEGKALAMEYTQNLEASDVEYIVQHTDDLSKGIWSAAVVTRELLSTEGNRARVRVSMSVPAGGRFHFMRLKVRLRE